MWATMTKSTKQVYNKVKELFNSYFGEYRLINVISASNNGVADLIILADGYHFEIEVKGNNDKVSDIQIMNLIECNDNGGIGLIITPEDFEDLNNILNCITNYVTIEPCVFFDLFSDDFANLKYPPQDYVKLLSHCTVDF